MAKAKKKKKSKKQIEKEVDNIYQDSLDQLSHDWRYAHQCINELGDDPIEVAATLVETIADSYSYKWAGYAHEYLFDNVVAGLT